jgi:RNA polymerase sigma factor (sigma-70 family)
MTHEDDPAALLAAAADGDREAWDLLVARYSRLLWSIGLLYRMDRSDVADAFQNTWLRLLENLDRIQDPSRVGAWLATTFRRECSAILRKTGRTISTDSNALALAVDQRPGNVPGGIQREPGPEGHLLRAERDSLLWEAFAQLDERCQQILRILVTDAHDGPPAYRQAAEKLRMPTGSLGPTRARCLARFRHHLRELGIYDGGTGS